MGEHWNQRPLTFIVLIIFTYTIKHNNLFIFIMCGVISLLRYKHCCWHHSAATLHGLVSNPAVLLIKQNWLSICYVIHTACHKLLQTATSSFLPELRSNTASCSSCGGSRISCSRTAGTTTGPAPSILTEINLGFLN